MDALSEIWNEDGTPRRPAQDQGAEHAFADLAMEGKSTNQELYLSYARVRAEALANQPASVGDMIHVWVPDDMVCRAAVVTENDLFTNWVSASMFIPGQLSVQPCRELEHHENKKGSKPSWHWPESE